MKIKAYKLFKVDDEFNPYPLFIDSNKALKLNSWIEAKSPLIKDMENLKSNETYIIDKTGNATLLVCNNKAKMPTKRQIQDSALVESRYIHIKETKTGKHYYNVGLNGNGQIALFAMRPGWHSTNVTSLRHIGISVNHKPTYRRENERWFEIEISSEVDYNDEAQNNQSKDIQTHIPTNGFYEYKTNSNASDNQKWYISGAIKIIRMLSVKECQEIAINNDCEIDLPYKSLAN